MHNKSHKKSQNLILTRALVMLYSLAALVEIGAGVGLQGLGSLIT